MKKRLLFLTCLATWTLAPAFADTTKLTEANGWTKVTDLTNLSDYYYVLVDNAADKMVRLRANDEAEFSKGTRMYYVESIEDPISNPSFLWYIEPCDVAKGKYYFRNVDYSYVQIQTESDGAHVLDINDVAVGNTWSEMTLAYADGAWTIKNSHFSGDNYWGYWSTTDNRVAGNKSGQYIGKFQIYACSRAKLAEKLGGGATPSDTKDLTKLLICPDFNNPKDNIGCGGWASDPQIANDAFNNGVGESFNQSTCVISQVVKGLPAGSYTVSLQGFYRPGNKNVADKTTSNVALFVNNIEQPLDNIYNNNVTSTSGYTGTWLTVAIDGTNYYCPDNTVAANYAFNTLNLYKQTIDVVVTDGQLTIGMRKTGYVNQDWICFDNFALTYKGFDNSIYAANLEALKATASELYENIKDLSNSFISDDVKSALSAAKGITVAEETEDAYNTAINSVNTAINNAKNAVVTNFKTTISGTAINVGFDAGEYAPFNPYINVLATAKTVAGRTNLSYDEAIEAIKDYTAVSDAANTAEVNAFFDAQFEACKNWASGATNSTPTGWRKHDGNTDADKVRYAYPEEGSGVNKSGLTYGAASGCALFFKSNGNNATGGTYGSVDGYTLPLKANTVYTLTFKYAGWGNTDATPVVSFKKSDAADYTTIKTLASPGIAGNSATSAWPTATLKFLTGEAGNYIIKFADSNNGKQFVITDLSLLRATAVDVTLDETATTTPETPNYANVTLNRPFAAGWNTLCLPFGVKADVLKAQLGDDVEVYTFTGYENEALIFTRSTLSEGNTTAIEAGQPYVVKMSAAKESTTFNSVNISVAEPTVVAFGGVSFTGNYTNGMSMNDKYGFKTDGSLAKGTDKATLKGYRAYLTVAAGSEVKLNAVNFGGETTTAILSLDNATEQIEAGAAIYNIAGQRVQQPVRGLYIVGGRKVIIR